MNNLPPLTPTAALVADGGTVLKFTLAKGDDGIFQTLAAMEALARRAKDSVPIQRMAADIKTIAANSKVSGDIMDAIRVYAQMQHKLKFREDPMGVEFVREPTQIALQIFANETLPKSADKRVLVDCDDHSTLAVALLLALGHSGAFVIVSDRDKPRGSFVHVFPALVRDDGETLFPIDAQEKIPFGNMPPFGRAAVWRVMQ